MRMELKNSLISLGNPGESLTSRMDQIEDRMARPEDEVEELDHTKTMKLTKKEEGGKENY